MLDSSPSSAAIAGELGLPYILAAFIRPTLALEAFETYRDRFQPSDFGAGPADPYGMLALNVACAETNREAARLRASSEAAYRRMARSAFGPPPAVKGAVTELGGVPDPTPPSLEPDEWPRAVSGSPSTVAALLDRMTDQVGAGEVIVQNLIEDPEDGIRSQVPLRPHGKRFSPIARWTVPRRPPVRLRPIASAYIIGVRKTSREECPQLTSTPFARPTGT